MTATALFVSCGIGLIFVLVWGLLCYVASSTAEFKPLFFGGLANFVFFIGGYVASYLARFEEAPAPDSHVSIAQIGGQAALISPAVTIYVALAVLVALLVTNLFSGGFTNAVDRMRNSKALDLTAAGYRDIQIYAGGMIWSLCTIALALFSLHLGSVRPGTTYVTVLFGVVLSFGIQGLLYLLFGVFFDFQIFRIFNVTAPEVLGTYGRATRKLVGIAITSMLAVFAVLLLSAIMWGSMALGSLVSRL